MEYRVVIADDHEIVRTGIMESLANAEASFDVVAQAVNGLEAIAAVKQHMPDLLFLDISMPLASGAEVMTDIKRWSPDTRIVVLTGILASGALANIVENGAHGIFSKSAPMQAVIDQLPILLAGGHYIAPELVESIEQGRQSAQLTDRERQTLNMILSGRTNREIADLLNISPKTVDKHRTSLMGKLQVHSVAELMVRAIRDGLIDTSSQTF